MSIFSFLAVGLGKIVMGVGSFAAITGVTIASQQASRAIRTAVRGDDGKKPKARPPVFVPVTLKKDATLEEKADTYCEIFREQGNLDQINNLGFGYNPQNSDGTTRCLFGESMKNNKMPGAQRFIEKTLKLVRNLPESEYKTASSETKSEQSQNPE